MRASSGVLFALLATALAMPAFAMGSHKASKKEKPPSVPNCEHFSSVKMAQLIHVSSLEFEGKNPGGNICEWKGAHRPGHYSDLLTIDVTAESRAVFAKAKQIAKKSAAERGALFRTHGAALFYVGQVFLSDVKGPCEPENTVPELGPPACSGDPPWATISVDSYGALKPRGPKAFVAVGLAREYTYNVGEVREVISLDKAIMSSRIR
ncbi:MAG: hypothetical protein ACYDA6_04935 [Solirubrobacteraceae bacterium]